MLVSADTYTQIPTSVQCEHMVTKRLAVRPYGMITLRCSRFAHADSHNDGVKDAAVVYLSVNSMTGKFEARGLCGMHVNSSSGDMLRASFKR